MSFKYLIILTIFFPIYCKKKIHKIIPTIIITATGGIFIFYSNNHKHSQDIQINQPINSIHEYQIMTKQQEINILSNNQENKIFLNTLSDFNKTTNNINIVSLLLLDILSLGILNTIDYNAFSEFLSNQNLNSENQINIFKITTDKLQYYPKYKKFITFFEKYSSNFLFTNNKSDHDTTFLQNMKIDGNVTPFFQLKLNQSTQSFTLNDQDFNLSYQEQQQTSFNFSQQNIFDYLLENMNTITSIHQDNTDKSSYDIIIDILDYITLSFTICKNDLSLDNITTFATTIPLFQQLLNSITLKNTEIISYIMGKIEHLYLINYFYFKQDATINNLKTFINEMNALYSTNYTINNKLIELIQKMHNIHNNDISLGTIILQKIKDLPGNIETKRKTTMLLEQLT